MLTISGCGAARSTIVVPPEAVREWAYNTDGQTGEGRYVVRMTDGKREWEVEFPDAVYGSEVRVPLKNGAHQMRYSGERSGATAADRELDDAERAARDKAATQPLDPIYDLVDQPGKGAAPKTPAKKNKASYLMGIAQVRQLYESRNLEIALVQLVELEKDYPNDEKLLAMKGSIYRKLGRNNLARAAWERVLALNPDNTVVAGALRALAEEEDKDKAAPKPRPEPSQEN
jgi:tetratricopeptide (TPR) repeat protein